MTSVAPYGLDFVLFFIVDKVRWWSGVVLTVLFCFDIWGKKGCVEYRVYGPLRRQLKSIGYGGYFFRDFEGSIPSRG